MQWEAMIMWMQRRAPAGRVPDELPVLDRGQHRSPETGACLMEYVSVLAGDRFTDHPRCTDPALAALARLVNDRIERGAVRNALARLAPDLIGTGGRDPRVTPVVVAGCLRAAEAAGPLPRAAARRLARARARLARLERGDRRTLVLVRCERLVSPVEGAVGSALAVLTDRLRGRPRRESDTRLHDLLRDVAADCHAITQGTVPAEPTEGGGLRRG
ncbi:MAG: hypothetical protein L0H64_20125 [Pseudonocardia sp.]|nr:hypothetical protein [Pseudonocardia sp.]